MPLNKNPSTWEKQDILFLKDNEIEEFARLEYKRELNLSSKGRKKACKDVSSFANGLGGTIIYGIEEEREDLGSIPKEIVPLTYKSIKEQLENILLSGITPKVTFWIHSIDVDGGFCLAVHIPQSLSTHMVTIGKENRYYIRRNYQAEPMTEPEVKEHYAKRLKIIEDIKERYYKERTDIAIDIPSYQLVIVPLVADPYLINPRAYEENRFNLKLYFPQGDQHTPTTPRYRIAGKKYVSRATLLGGKEVYSIINFSGTCERTVLFEPELIEFPKKTLIANLYCFLQHFSEVLSIVGYYGPITIFYRVTGTKKAIIKYEDYNHVPPVNELEEEFVYRKYDYIDTVKNNCFKLLHEIMDHLWMFYGCSYMCPYFDKDSNLVDSF